MSRIRVTTVSRDGRRTFVRLRRTHGLIAKLLGAKDADETYWTDDRIYWYTQDGKEVGFREWPDTCNLNEWVREHDARVKLFGHELA